MKIQKERLKTFGAVYIQQKMAAFF